MLLGGSWEFKCSQKVKEELRKEASSPSFYVHCLARSCQGKSGFHALNLVSLKTKSWRWQWKVEGLGGSGLWKVALVEVCDL